MSAPISNSASVPSLEPGRVVGDRYTVERLIGEGGMGAVYLASHNQLGTQVAVKVLARVTDLHVARFLREARILANLRSEHVAKVLDFGVIDDLGAPYMVMEFLAGHDLGALLEGAYEPLPPALAADHVLEACEALAEAHRAGIVHRDIKPSNLFLAQRVDGSPMIKVLDFGIAKTADGLHERSLTSTDMVFGSPAYMSPEQIRSSKLVGPPTDVWSLGLVLYEMVAGKHPFRGDTAAGIVASIAADAPEPLLGHPLWPLLQTVLNKDPSQRPTLQQFAAGLGPYAGDRGRTALRRIERLSGASVPPPQDTIMLAGANGSGPRPAQSSTGVSGTGPTVAVDREALAAARTTMGNGRGGGARGKITLALGGVLVIAVGVVLGLRVSTRAGAAQAGAAGSTSSTTSAIDSAPVEPPPAPVSEPVPSATAEPMATAEPVPSASAAPLSGSAAPVGAERTAKGGRRTAAGNADTTNSKAGSGGADATNSKTPPRVGDFN